jgi:GPH family glycoside/pentoside/hexuronide:cation symporter
MYFADMIPGISPLIYMSVIIVLMAPFVSIFLLVPRTLLADIMDYDAKITGYRREAMYNGMEGLVTKIAQGLAPLIMGGLFTWFGNTAQNPLGIKLCAVSAGGLAIISFIAFMFYPLKK